LGEWLRQEYGTRASITSAVDECMQRMGLEGSLMTHPDYSNQEENISRPTLLMSSSRRGIVGWIPNCMWKLVTLDEGEIGEIRTISGEDWNIRTRGTFLLSKSFELLCNEEGRNYLDSSGEGNWVRDVDVLIEIIKKQGLHGPIIIVKRRGELRLLEGYHRIAAYSMLNSGKTPNATFYFSEPPNSIPHLIL
jgi:hypothetical protein